MTQAIIEARKIVQNENICGGAPTLEGTRIRVSDIVVQHEYHNLSPEQITQEFPQLSIADIYSALTFYHEHPKDIRNEIFTREKLFEEGKKASLQ